MASPELGRENEPVHLRAAVWLLAMASRNAARAPEGWLCSHPHPGVPARGPALPRHQDMAQAGREPQLLRETQSQAGISA